MKLSNIAKSCKRLEIIYVQFLEKDIRNTILFSHICNMAFIFQSFLTFESESGSTKNMKKNPTPVSCIILI